MNFYTELLSKLLENEKMIISFPDLRMNAKELIELTCYNTLNKVRSIIADESLTDFECIEAITCLLEDIGSNGGTRHDF